MGRVYLSFPSAIDIDKIEPLTELCTNNTASSFSSDDEEDLTSVSVIGLKDLETFYGCISCSNAITPTDQYTGICDKCNITQKLISQQTARLIIKSGEAKITLKAFDKIIKIIAQSDTSEVSAQELLFAPAFDCSFDKFHVITRVSRK